MFLWSPLKAMRRIVEEACTKHGFTVESFTHTREFILRKEYPDKSHPISLERVRVVVKSDGVYLWHYRVVYGCLMLVNELAINERKTLQRVLDTLRPVY